MASTIATFAALLKTRYASKYEELVFSNRPLLSMLNKNEDFAGDGLQVPIVIGAPQGSAASSVALSQTNSTNVVSTRFTVTCGDYYGSVFFEDKVLEASRGNLASFIDNKSIECDLKYESMADVMAAYVYGNSGNSIGRRASVASNTITLTEPTQIVNFEVGMLLRASANDGSDTSHTLRAGTACTVTAVDRTNGTVTVDNVANITLFANNDFLFRDGDFRGNTGTFVIPGLQSFIWADESPTPLYGMTRTSDAQRLAGCRVPAAVLTGLSIEDKLKTLATYMTGKYKGPGADKAFMNPEDWQNLEQSLSNKGIRPLADESTKFGFESITFSAGGTRMKIYCDRWCPKGTVFFLKMNTWTLHSMRSLIHPLDKDGLTILRGTNNNAYEYRLVSYPALVTNAPGWNGRVGV